MAELFGAEAFDPKEEAGVPGLLEGGASPAAVGEFFHAARRYYRAAPWRGIEAGEVLCARIEALAWERFILVMGQDEEQTGLLIYADLEQARQALSAASPLDELPPDGLLALTFEHRGALPEGSGVAS